jgi:hypothetical protein
MTRHDTLAEMIATVRHDLDAIYMRWVGEK